MGNCICVTDNKTMTSLSGDESGSYNKTRRRSRRRRSTVFHEDDGVGEKLLGETRSATSSSSSSSSCGSREIKIRMTKKELEDLMRNIGLKSLTAEEVLSKLLFDGGDQIGFSAVDLCNHHQPWKPALQSIPEID